MTCSLFDVPCHIWQFVAPFWFWIQVSFWCVVGLVALGGLYKIHQIAGWPGVVTVLTLGAAAFVYNKGYQRGKSGKSFNPIENGSEDAPDFKSPTLHKKRPAPKKGQRVYNPDTQQWELKE